MLHFIYFEKKIKKKEFLKTEKLYYRIFYQTKVLKNFDTDSFLFIGEKLKDNLNTVEHEIHACPKYSEFGSFAS